MFYLYSHSNQKTIEKENESLVQATTEALVDTVVSHHHQQQQQIVDDTEADWYQQYANVLSDTVKKHLSSHSFMKTTVGTVDCHKLKI